MNATFITSNNCSPFCRHISLNDSTAADDRAVFAEKVDAAMFEVGEFAPTPEALVRGAASAVFNDYRTETPLCEITLTQAQMRYLIEEAERLFEHAAKTA